MRTILYFALAVAAVSPIAATAADEAPKGKMVGSYFVGGPVDPMTDEARVGAILKSGNVTLAIGCMVQRNAVQAFITAPTDIPPTSLMRSEITFRVNANSPLKQDWYYKGNVAYTSNDKNLRTLVAELRNAFKLVVRIPTWQGGFSDAVFDVSDTVPALKEMAAQCGDQEFSRYLATL